MPGFFDQGPGDQGFMQPYSPDAIQSQALLQAYRSARYNLQDPVPLTSWDAPPIITRVPSGSSGVSAPSGVQGVSGLVAQASGDSIPWWVWVVLVIWMFKR